VLSCFLKAFTDDAVTTVSLKLFHASTLSVIGVGMRRSWGGGKYHCTLGYRLRWWTAL